MLKLSTLLLLLSFIFCTYSKAQQPSTVTIALNDWSSQRVLSQVVGKLMQRSGIDVQYRDIVIDDQWGALSNGRVDIQMEVWQGTMAEAVSDLLSRHMAVDAGTHIATSREDWWYPDYVASMCPGLPDWHALKRCEALFHGSGSDKAVFYTGPWYHNDGARIRALQLNFTIERLASDKQLWQLLQSAYQQRRPIVLFNWAPNWTDSRLSGTFIEFPDYQPACYQDPAWGINPDMSYDCGSPKRGWIKKLVSNSFKQQHGCWFQKLQQIRFDTKMMADAAALIIIDELPEPKAVARWIKQHDQIWQHWLQLTCDD